MLYVPQKLRDNNKYRLCDKNEFIAIDFFRVICALGVIAIHLYPLKNFSHLADYFIVNILTRVCVPFFFLTSGFFLQKKIQNFDKIKVYVFHLIKMYFLYSLIYFPQTVYEHIESNDSLIHSVLSYVKNLFFVGSYSQLWYFIALIIATILLYLSIVKIKLSDKTVFIVVTVLYIIGVLGNAYITPLKESLSLSNHPVLWAYFKAFTTTRNGIFFGLPYVFWGYLISKNKERIIKRKYWLYSIIFFAAMTGEAFIAHEFFGCKGQDMLFTMPATSIMLFLCICFIKGNSKHSEIAKNCRKISVLFFGFHLFIYFYIKFVLNKFFDIELNNLIFFFIVVIVNFAVSVLIIRISDKKGFRWLKKFY